MAPPRWGRLAAPPDMTAIGHSVGVKFRYLSEFLEVNETNDNHVAIQSNGIWMDEFTQAPYAVTKCTKPTGVAGCMSNGHLWSVWIDYDGVNMHVAVADGSTKRPADLVNAPISVPTILSLANAAYVGFTA